MNLFLIAGAMLGTFGVVSFLFAALAAFGGLFDELDTITYWVNVVGALLRNALIAAAGYAAYVQPNLAAPMAWVGTSMYVVLAFGQQYLMRGNVRVGDLIPTFYLTVFALSTCAAVLTVMVPNDA